MNLRKTIRFGVLALMLLQTKAFCQANVSPSNQPKALVDTNALMLMLKDYGRSLATNPPLSNEDFTNKMAAVHTAYQNEKIDKGVAMVETMLLTDNRSQDFYGKIIDQYGQPVVGAYVKCSIHLSGWYSEEDRKEFMVQTNTEFKTQTDTEGLFQFTGLRSASLNIIPEKKGFQIEGHGLGRKGMNGPDTSLNNRAVYSMWKLKGPEPMVHDRKSYRVKSDGRIYVIDLVNKKMTEGTNEIGDLYVQFQRPAQIKPHQDFEWSFALTAIGGGVIEVTNDDYLNIAPDNSYQPQYKFNMTPANPKWSGWNGEVTFYLKSRGGKVYGHFHVRVNPVSRDGSSLEIESYVNPAGSRNLEFDPAKEIR